MGDWSWLFADLPNLSNPWPSTPFSNSSLPQAASVAQAFGYGFNPLNPGFIRPMHGMSYNQVPIGPMYGFGLGFNHAQADPMFGFNQSQNANMEKIGNIGDLDARVAALERHLHVKVEPKSEPKDATSLIIISDDDEDRKDESEFIPKTSSTCIKEEENEE